MQFSNTEWALLLPLLIFLGWWVRSLRLWMPLRALSLLLLVLALMGPEIRRYSDGLDLFVLIDRSDSASSAMGSRLAEWEGLIEGARGQEDRLLYLDFASEVSWREPGSQQVFEGRRDRTRLAHAVRTALSGLRDGRQARLLVLSDGMSTESLNGLTEILREKRVPLDFRLAQVDLSKDYRVDAVHIANRVQKSEPFLIDARLSSEVDGPVDYQVLRNGKEIGRGQAVLREGRANLRFTDRLSGSGAVYYEVRTDHPEDERRGNNQLGTWVEIADGPRILLVTNYENDPLAEVLRQQGFRVESLKMPGELNVGRLVGASVVIFNNVPAHLIGQEFLNGLDFHVREQGAGFLMVGGPYSFGSGGYFDSELDSILPVSMDLREEHRRLAVNMAIVMDRSGSMGQIVQGGLTKMDLANSGAARAAELLGDSDAISVFAVDSEAHTVVPLTRIKGNRSEIDKRVRRIVSGGGGIYVYNGLVAGWNEMRKSEAGIRHLILFADAADAEQPGLYEELLAQMTAQQATVSVIALGSPTDPDATFLCDVAALGNGRAFFAHDPQSLPNVFSQEAVAVARSAFVEDVTPTQDTGEWLQIADKPINWPEQVPALNLCYTKPEASAALLSKDDYQAPLVASWPRGAGRSAAICFPLSGKWAGTLDGWSDRGNFLQTLVRWLKGEDMPPGVGLSTEVTGTTLSIDLQFDESWEKRLASSPPRILLAGKVPGETRELSWRRMAPGHLVAEVELESGLARGAVRVGSHALPFGPIAIQEQVEWQQSPKRLEALRALSQVSGGTERLLLQQAWEPPSELRHFESIRNWFYTLAMLLFLLEAALWRVGIVPGAHLGRRNTQKAEGPIDSADTP